jgi:DnaK suppressor protein
VAKTSRNKMSAGGKSPVRGRSAVKARPTKAKSSSSAGSNGARAVAAPARPRTTTAASTKAGSAVRAGSRDLPANAQPIGSASRVEPLQNRPIPEAVPTDGKPRKNQAGLSMRELEHFRDLLLDKRRELVGDMSQMEREALRSSGGTNLSTLPLHMADMGTDNYEQEFTLGLVEKDRNLLREINAALAKIQNGTYGICEGTGKPISKPRLEAQPWAKYSIEYARQLERGMGR